MGRVAGGLIAPRLRHGAYGLILGALLLLVSPVAAQVRPPADTAAVPPDTTRVDIPPGELPADTFLVPPAQDTVPADSLVPAAGYPQIPEPRAAGWSAGVWLFDRETLASFHGLTLLELLDRVPGLVIVRGGGPGAPVGISAFGLGGGRLRVFRDGWELDPLGEAAFDVQRIALADLDGVRVERGLGEIRIHLDTYALATREPRSWIGAGTGDYDTRFLRALFATPVGEQYALTVAADIVDTDGWRRREPFGTNTIVARAVRNIGSRAAVGLEYRTSKFDRATAAFPLSLDRREVLVRGRSRVSESLLLDGVFGMSEVTLRGDTTAAGRSRRYQASTRAILTRPGARFEAGGRLRAGGDNAVAAPVVEVFSEAEIRPTQWISAGASGRATSFGGTIGSEIEGRLRAGLGESFGAFVEANVGERFIGLPLGEAVADEAAAPVSLLSAGGGLRAGAELTAAGITIGAAALAMHGDRLAPLALPFEPDSAVIDSGRTTGAEAHVSVPLGRLPIRFAGSYLRWLAGVDGPYLPVDQGRASLVFHDRYYDGQLEPNIRLGFRYSGVSTAFGAGGAISPTQRYGLFDLAIEVRIIDVRAFVTFENPFNYQLAADIPELRQPGVRVLYGARWDFRN